MDIFVNYISFAKATQGCTVISIIIAYKRRFSIYDFTTPLDRLFDIASCFYFAIGRVSVSCPDVAIVAVDLADILGEVPAVCIPGAVNPNGQRAGGYGLCSIPGDEPHDRVVVSGEVDAGNLQVAAIDVALVERYAAIGCYLLVGAATHGIVGAFDHRVAFAVRESHGAILRVVGGRPDTR